MALTKNDTEVQCMKSLVDSYEMPVFAVDMIKDAYNTTDPFIIANLLIEIFEIDNLSIEEIIELIHLETIPLDKSFTCTLANIF
jgi:hypothetical protein|tara:strand:+ start:2221 stop:2472 length:252 start_codon:yes stop_codon:yes gene_type:complete